MNQDDLDQFRQLPQRGHSVWSGGWAYFPMWIDNGQRPPFRPRVPIWLNEREGGVHIGHSDRPVESVTAAEALEALIEFATDGRRSGHYRPGRIDVNDAELAAYLEQKLEELAIEVRFVPAIKGVQEAEDALAKTLNGPQVRSLLTAPGIDDALLEHFAAAAVGLYQAAPWRYLVDRDYLVAEGTSHPRTMGCVSVLGAAKQTEGLSFFASPQDLFALADGTHDAAKNLTGGSITFDPLSDIPVDDAARWVQHGWPVAPGRLYPLCFFLERGKTRGPTVAELSHLIDWMEALAQTSEDDIDTGRWEKTQSSAGRRMVITLPNLLKPVGDPALRPTGSLFDRRSMEAVQAKIARYFEEHPAGSLDEMNRIMQEKFSGSIDDLPDEEPRNPAERAQQLCYQAFDSFGRRRVILAREAIEIDPDCADAHNLLAEAAYEPADALRHYEQAVSAAQRTLGSSFEESIGHFWGIHATRPYMRAREGCAHMLDHLGQTEDAIGHGWDMLRLNPNDNQGIRYSLLAWLLKVNADEQAGNLLKQYDERTAHWSYAKVLLAYRLSGKSTAAERELATAMKENRHVPERLLSGGEFEPVQSYSLGSPEEADFAATELYPAYDSTPGALEWLADAYCAVGQIAIAHERAARRKQLERKKVKNKGHKRKRR